MVVIPKAPYVEDGTELPGVRRILKRTKARISQPKFSHAPAPESLRPGGLIGANSETETNRVRLETVEAELELERGSAAALILLRSEIAVEREAAKKFKAHAAQLEETLNQNQEHGAKAIAGLETRIAGLQKQLDTAILEARSVSLELEEERESSQRSALEQQKLRDQLAEKSEAAQRAEARSAELETCLERSVRDASSKVVALESQIADLRGQLDQSFQSRQGLEQQDKNLSAALGQLESSALEVLRQLSTRHNASVGGAMNQRP
jgi:hypothetical protein